VTHSLPLQLAQHAPSHPLYASAPLWRREPFRILFPLGALLSWAGVLPWLLFGVGAAEEYRSIYHSLTQVEGFLACFATGFLFTFVPRRTRTQAASRLEIGLACVLPLCTVAAAWQERWAVSQLFWLGLLALLVQFVARRMRHALGSVPPAFVWVPAALLFGAAGSVLAGVGAARGDDWMWLHDIGRGLVLQGVFSGLVLGTGSFLLPAITRGQTPPDAKPTRGARLLFAFHLGLAALFAASFFLEQTVSLRSGFALRAACALAALLPAKPWLWPALAGLHRRIVWVAQWMLPLGFACVALVPEHRRIGLHLVFIGCFAALVLAISIHVTLSHTGRAARLERTPLSLVALAGLLALALASRLLVDLDAQRAQLWIGCAAGCFLAATLAWAWTLLAGRERRASAG
jgi:uncharacterized protein involved in response to NO